MFSKHHDLRTTATIQAEPFEPLPSYEDVVAEPSAPRPIEKLEQQADEDEDVPTCEPPPFSVSPITLVLLPRSHLISPTRPNSRPLYELTRPLDGHCRTVAVAEVLPTSQLREDGRLKEIKDRQIIYKIYEHMTYPPSKNETEIDAQTSKCIQGTVLKHLKFPDAWEARRQKAVGINKVNWKGIDDRNLLFTAQAKKGVLQWKDNRGILIATETTGVHRDTEPEQLDILVPLERRMLDLLVAVWLARIHQDTQKTGQKEDREEEKRRDAAQKVQDALDGKPHGKIHNCGGSIFGSSRC